MSSTPQLFDSGKKKRACCKIAGAKEVENYRAKALKQPQI